MNKILFSSLDNKFLQEIIELFQQDYNVKIDMFHQNKNSKRRELLEWADIIFCEWCEINALWYSINKKHNQKLFIRLHRYELFTSFFFRIRWKNVNNIIFISPQIKKLANKHLLQKIYLKKNNFNWQFYLDNNPDLFNTLSDEKYNKEWAWMHWIKSGNRMRWRRPVIKLKDNINYNKICNKFKHFNGGEVIWNYVKSSMFIDIPKENENEYNIGMMGILPKSKRLDIAIDIIENLIKKDKRYKLYVLGKWYTEWQDTLKRPEEIKYYKKLENRINYLKLKNHVIFDKFTYNPEIWFRKIGYLLSVSDIEGCHQAVAEAITTGTIPFIYGKALKENKLDEIYPKKYCFYEENTDKLCNKIHFYSNNLEEKNIISEECKKYSKDNFKLNDIYNNIKNLILNNKTSKLNTIRILFIFNNHNHRTASSILVNMLKNKFEISSRFKIDYYEVFDIFINSITEYDVYRSLAYILENKRMTNDLHMVEKKLENNYYDVIFGWSNPYIAATISVALGKKYNIPIILRLGDFKINHYAIARLKDYKEANSLNIPNKILAEKIIKYYGEEYRYKINVIPQHYNPYNIVSDFTNSDKQINFLHTGNIYNERKIDFFIKCLSQLDESIKNKIKLKFIGCHDKLNDDIKLCKKYRIQSDFTMCHEFENWFFKKNFPYEKIKKFIIQSDILFHIEYILEDNHFLSFKLIDYLSYNKPIITITQKNSPNHMLSQECGFAFGDIEDNNQLTQTLIDIIDNKLDNKLTINSVYTKI